MKCHQLMSIIAIHLKNYRCAINAQHTRYTADVVRGSGSEEQMSDFEPLEDNSLALTQEYQDTHDGLQKNTVKWLENYIGGGGNVAEQVNGEVFVDISTSGCLYGLKGSSRLLPDFNQFTYLREIKLVSAGVKGELPLSLCECSCLETLELGNNHIEGTIPPQIGNCLSLQRLSLFNNSITGK
jgi:hypothetical protein